MAIKISELDQVLTTTGAEYVPVVQDGETKKATVSDLLQYKVYQADVTYNGTSMVVNVLRDTLLDISIIRLLAGSFRINSESGQFVDGKTVAFANQNNNDGNPPNVITFNTIRRGNNGQILLNTLDVNLDPPNVDQTDLLTHLSIEIRVYP